jgi:hypothetical protein
MAFQPRQVPAHLAMRMRMKNLESIYIAYKIVIRSYRATYRREGFQDHAPFFVDLLEVVVHLLFLLPNRLVNELVVHLAMRMKNLEK